MCKCVHCLLDRLIKNDILLLEESSDGSIGPSQCLNGGTYKTFRGKCECKPDYTGQNCETGQSVYVDTQSKTTPLKFELNLNGRVIQM